MKLIHIADLHFGKSLHGVSLIESGDQPHWAEQFLALCREEAPDAVLIAGDVYDRGAPGNQAVELLDKFLTGLSQMGIPVLMVSGNHDSGTKLAFAGTMLEKSGLYIAGGIRGGVKRVRLTDEYGPVDFWLLPYVFPALAAEELGDDTIRDYDTAVRKLLAAQNIDTSIRNVIIAHQNVMANGTEAERGGSETMVGGVGEIDYTAFDGFEYAALGHIHSAQAMGRDTVRYAGSPLCYHFSELRRPRKGPVVVTLGPKGTEAAVEIRQIPTLHLLREVTGCFRDVLRGELEREAGGEFLRVVLTDAQVPMDAGAQLRAVLESRGSRLMELTRETQSGAMEAVSAQPGQQKLDALFCDFYRERTGTEGPDEKLLELIRFTAELLESGDADTAKTLDAQAAAIVKFAMEQGD